MTTARTRMPVVFVGHGSPMNAIEDNAWSRGFAELGATLFATQPKPAAIVAISAHWFVPGTFVTGNAQPPTIHDFGGFPDELFAMQYPAPGEVALAQRIVTDLAALGHAAALRDDWGLDHGTWSVLHHMRPAADVPVVQLSIDHRLPPERHLALGRALAPLREQGVLVLGSGNLVHNLRDAFTRLHTRDLSTPPWAARFDAEAADAITRHDVEHLAQLLPTEHGRSSHPSPEHYLPILYAAGASDANDAVSFPISGFDLGSLSMRSVVWS